MSEVERKITNLIRTGETTSGEDFSLEEIGTGCMADYERHSWQEFVPSEIRQVWPELSVETRLALCFLAQKHAHAFEPDLT